MERKPILLLVVGLICIGLSLTCSLVGLFGFNSTRHADRLTAPLLDDPSGTLVYRVWSPYPIPESGQLSARANHVAILFHGFSATQSMMYPLMRQLTALGYFVITADLRGHGESGGLYNPDTSQRLLDFDSLMADVQTRPEYAALDWTHLTVVGHSMGGGAAAAIGAYRSNIFITIGVAPMDFSSVVNTTNPGNFAVISGENDQVFSPASLLDQFQISTPGAVIGESYGDPNARTARRLAIIPGARHESEMADNLCLGEIVSFIEYCYGYLPANQIIPIDISFQTGIIFMGVIFAILAVIFLGVVGNLVFVQEKQHTIIAEKFSPLLAANPKFSVMKWWWAMYGLGLLGAMVLFMLTTVLLPSGFASSQTLLVALPGITALLVLRKYSKQTAINVAGKDLVKLSCRNLSGRVLLYSLGLFGLTALLLNLGLGEYYLSLFPWNIRIVYILAIVPINFLLWLPQGWLFGDILGSSELKEKTYSRTVGQIFVMKFAAPALLCIIAWAFGSYIFTFIALFYLIDIVGTVLFVVNYRTNRQYHGVMAWIALTNAVIYLGYGVFMKFTGFGS
jgi:alpha/beta superfamily hydrolase